MASRLTGGQAKNKYLEADAAEIRLPAERRVGQMMQAQAETVGFCPPGRKPDIGSAGDPISRPRIRNAVPKSLVRPTLHAGLLVPPSTAGGWLNHFPTSRMRLQFDIVLGEAHQ
jgi:hypothetical protein